MSCAGRHRTLDTRSGQIVDSLTQSGLARTAAGVHVEADIPSASPHLSPANARSLLTTYGDRSKRPRARRRRVPDTSPTWELELLISGAVLFALFQIPSALTSFFARIEPHGLVRQRVVRCGVLPADPLSAGADVQLRGIAQGSPSQQSSGATSVGVFTPSEPTLSTRGLLTVRFYL